MDQGGHGGLEEVIDHDHYNLYDPEMDADYGVALLSSLPLAGADAVVTGTESCS